MSVPTGSPGQNAQGLAKVREALKLLEAQLPSFPAGTDIWKALHDTIGKLAKVAPASAENQGVQQTALRELQQGAGKDAQLDAVMRSLGGAGSGAGGGAAAAPPPAAAGPGAAGPPS
jgi:hypothetical protein